MRPVHEYVTARLPLAAVGKSRAFEMTYRSTERVEDRNWGTTVAREAATVMALDAARELLPTDLYPEGRPDLARALAYEARRWTRTAEAGELREYATLYRLGDSTLGTPLARGPVNGALHALALDLSREDGGAKIVCIADDGRVAFVVSVIGVEFNLDKRGG